MLDVMMLHALLSIQAGLPRIAFMLLMSPKQMHLRPPWSAVSGPDAKRPAQPSEDKRNSEQMLCAATLELNDYSDTTSLQQATASLLHLPAEVLTAKPHAGPKSIHHMHVLQNST